MALCVTVSHILAKQTKHSPKFSYLPNLIETLFVVFAEDGTLSVSIFVCDSKPSGGALSKFVVSASTGESPMSLTSSEGTGSCLLVLLNFSALFPSLGTSTSFEEP